MKSFKRILFVAVAVGLLGTLVNSAAAQSNEKRRKAVQSFNKARSLAQSNKYDQSIDMFKQAMGEAQDASSSGQKGDDIVAMVKKKLPSIYYQKAIDDYKAFKSSQTLSNIETAINSFNDAAAAGTKYGQKSISDKASGNVTQLMYFKSLLQYRGKDYKSAMSTIDDVIKRNPNYAQAYYQKGLIYKDEDGNFNKALTMFDKAIDIANKNNNDKTARQAKESASAELVYRGSKLVENKKYSAGITMLNKALKYNPESSDAEFRLAAAYNGESKFDTALQHGQKALKYEKGGRSAKAKIYFQIASAYQGKGQFNQACDAYKNAAYGQFRDKAQHEMKYELKCKSQQ